MVVSAASVANEFLGLAKAEGDTFSLTQMKLQKLLFYAHAWYLAINDEPLFEDDVEAWPWGPVVRSVYNQTLRYGRSPVSAPLSDLQPVEGRLSGFAYMPAKPIENESVRQFIRDVWNVHKNLSAIELSNATHADGEPWTIVKEQAGSLDGKPTIPNGVIKAVYKEKLKVANVANHTSAA